MSSPLVFFLRGTHVFNDFLLYTSPCKGRYQNECVPYMQYFVTEKKYHDVTILSKILSQKLIQLKHTVREAKSS